MILISFVFMGDGTTMALVGYSDSEDSGSEPITTPKVIKKLNTSAKPSFQKVIDRTNPHIIKITLPEQPTPSSPEDDVDNGPPKKRAKVDGGIFNGFNALLPAPKRSAVTESMLGKTGAVRSLGSDVSLKTGAAPGFSREPMPTSENRDEGSPNGLDGDGGATSVEGLTGIILVTRPLEPNGINKPDSEPKKLGKSTMFKPLSVARKLQKKKTVDTAAVQKMSPTSIVEPVPRQKPASKVSLFSMNTIEKEVTLPTEGAGVYRPVLYQALDPDGQQDHTSETHNNNDFMEPKDSDTSIPPTSTVVAPVPQSLDSVAADLNLSASAKRQLFGRRRNSQNGNAATINVVNFNTDQEYAANELLRQAGEQAMHNPVRAIAAGKHSLKQLVSAASNQKEALEEHFATGRRNKKEAGSKYGW